MGFTVFQTVQTQYGSGFVQEVRDDCYVVQLIDWALAQGQSPTLYLQQEALKAIPGAFPGTTVSTTYGPACMESIRADGTHVARPINWKLANDTSATLFLQPECVKLDQTSGFIKGDEVMTVYGQGYIEAVRAEGNLVVKLNEWALAQGQSPTLYLSTSACVKVPGLKLGAIAKTVWGLVKVTEIRRDGTHVCVAVHWDLANATRPTFYIAPEAFALMSIKP